MNQIDVEKLKKILPKLIKEDDAIKGAIITALSGVLATKEDLKELIQHFDKRFEEINKRFEEQTKEFNKRFEDIYKRFDKVDERFNKIEGILYDIRKAIGKPFEQFARNVIIRILEAENIKNVKLKPTKLFDENRKFFPENPEVEIDGFSLEPPIIVEITTILRDIKKVENFIQKKKFVEYLYNKNFRGFFVAAGTELSSNEIADIEILLHKYNSELINL